MLSRKLHGDNNLGLLKEIGKELKKLEQEQRGRDLQLENVVIYTQI